MKGKLKSCLSCIPDVISFDMNPSTDDFMLISTDGIFQAMSISEVVEIDVYRLISSMKNTLNWRQKRVQTRLSALLFRIARYYRPNVTTCQPFYLLLEKVWLEHLKLGDFIYFISSIRYHK
jgi:serine/threonine protein phosphatase PrpC